MIATLGAAFAGALTWTFLEYWIHRGLGHGKRFRKNLFAVEHIRHHVEGNYFAPSWKKLVAAALAAGLIGVPAVLALGRLGIAYVGGLIGFYGVYEVLHRLEHVWSGLGAYGRWARRHHFTHHFSDARYNHGVTSPLWDLVFATYRRPGTIVVPRKLCMEWLKDPTTGGVRAAFAPTYVMKDG
jgi:sterol desaturase/sphingolipid hydroxylase (fatty acid hydroxylase superfamily)